MKNLIYYILVLCISFTASCKKENKSSDNESQETQIMVSSNYEGTWKNIKRSNEIVTIRKSGDNYVISIEDTKLIAKLVDDILEFSNQGFNFKAFIDNNDILHIDSETYNRLE